jgi:hypothetical protein
MRQVPVGYVVLRLPVDRNPFKEAGDKIDPALIDEQPVGNVYVTMVVNLFLPPPQESVGIDVGGYTDKPQVISAGP